MSGTSGATRLHGLCQTLIGLFAPLVPGWRRQAWRQEWRAEIFHRIRGIERRRGMERSRRLSWHTGGGLLVETLGAFFHAVSLLIQEWSFDMWLYDLRFALRTLRNSPGFTLVAVLILGIGIGIGGIAGSFSIVDAFFLRPMEFAQPESLVHLYRTDPQTDHQQLRFSMPVVRGLREEATVFEDLGAYVYSGRNVSGGTSVPEHLMVSSLTPNLLSILGVTPSLGRAFDESEGRAGAPRVVLLSHAVWQNHLGGRRDVVGQTLLLDGHAHSVVGVMPPSFNFPFGEVRLWTPLPWESPENGGEDRDFQPVGRLLAGVSRAQAQAALEPLYRHLEGEHSDEEVANGLAVVGLREALLFLFDLMQLVFVLALAANGFVLLIICANLANLMIGRALGRKREAAIRAMLGAGRSRLIRQLLTEGALLAALGGALGIAIAHWQTSSADRLIPEALFRTGAIGVDARVLAFTLAVALATTLFFALSPALEATRVDVVEAIKQGAGTASQSRAGSRSRDLMVLLQVSATVVLLVGAALMIQSVLALKAADLGFEKSQLLTMGTHLAAMDYPDKRQVAQFHSQVIAQVEAVPEVESAAFIIPLPLNFATHGVRFEVEGRVPASPRERLQARAHWASPNIVETLGLRLLQGRSFSSEDDLEAPRVALANRSFAARFWPNGEAVGKRIRVAGRTTEDPSPWTTLVGVVADSKNFFVNEEGVEILFFPQQQHPFRESFLMARTSGPPYDALPAVRQAVWAVHDNLPLSEVRSMEEVVGGSMMPWQGASGGLLGISVVALVLAALGIYGVAAFAANRRTHEIGIRVALGARARDVVGLVARQSAALAGIGLALGLVAAMALARVLSALLVGVGALDPLTFLVVAGLILAVALTATLVPAVRVARRDPMTALRHD